MRTTLTLDDDVASQLEQLRAESGRALKDLVNQALRLGLQALDEPPPRDAAPYRTPSGSLGGCTIGSLDDVTEAMAAAEGEAFK
ncbi:MAG: CopG family transcriptional regulator [Gemmatimonadota bacterium]